MLSETKPEKVKGEGFYKMSFSHVTDEKTITRIKEIINAYIEEKKSLPELNLNIQNSIGGFWVGEDFWMVPNPEYPQLCYLLSRDVVKSENFVWEPYLAKGLTPEGEDTQNLFGAL